MPADEMLDLVDEKDRVVGAATLADCLQHGLLHRAVAIVVKRNNGDILLQRRSTFDLWHPGLWTLSSTGHVRQGEAYGAAADRELSEELGLDADLRLVGKFLTPSMTDGKFTEREWVSLFDCTTDAPCRIDPVEVDSVREFDVDEVAEMISRGPLTPDAKFLIDEYLRSSSRREL
jgi:isopentenyldiphosphate isomerase